MSALPPSSIKNILYGRSNDPKILTIKKFAMVWKLHSLIFSVRLTLNHWSQKLNDLNSYISFSAIKILKWVLLDGSPWTYPRSTARVYYPPGGGLHCYKSLYKFEVRLPFSRQRDSLAISSASHRSSKALLTVERESRSSAAMVRRRI